MSDTVSTGRRARWTPWAILVAVTCVIAVAAGGRFLIGLVFDQVKDDFSVSHGRLSLIISASILVTGLTQPAVGWLVDRLSARIVVGGGLTFLSVGLLAVSQAGSLWLLALAYGLLVAPGLATITPAMTTPLVAGWFERRRATALSIVATGDPLGQAMVVPGLALLVGAFGWRDTYASLGLVVAVIIMPLLLVLLRDRDGMRRPTGEKSGATLREALSSRFYWQLAVGFIICGFTMSWVIVFFVDYTLSQGMSRGIAATGLSIMGGMSIVGALTTGWWADRTGNTLPLAVVYALRSAGFGILLLGGGVPVLLLAMFVIGFSWSATVPLTSSVTARLFGVRSLGAIFGLLFAVMPFGNAAGAVSIGYLYDVTGSYELSLIINLVAGLIAAIVVFPVQTAPLFRQVPLAPRLQAHEPVTGK